ncbi:MAG: hypothetical protein OEZ41_10715 [Nitrospirota bacterium]|nr:hypothetical protein [Nitrospirota bacterium]MDH5700419.1 hypothetical protein [Nitrospirota bacterium]
MVGSFIALAGVSVYAGEMEGSQLPISSQKGSKGDHIDAFVDGQYQKGSKGTLEGLSPGKHQVPVKVADHDHEILDTSDSIEIEVKEPNT